MNAAFAVLRVDPNYIPKAGPHVGVWHEEWRHDLRVNSLVGDHQAAAHHRPWIDNDFGLSSDCVWCNGHQNPSYVWFPKGHTFRDYTWEHLSQQVRGGRHLRNAAEAFRDAHRTGRKVEFEVKWVGPISDAELRQAFLDLAAIAHHEFGPDWQHHVRIKVLTCLRGGVPYALRVCKWAHLAGFETVILARYHARFLRFKGRTEVTYVRGSAVIR